MPLELTSFTDDLCCGYTWKVVDEAKLAELVAKLVIGRYRHVSKILLELEHPEPLTSDAAIDKAISLLESPPTEDARWHRDGWVFQMIAWVAIHKANDFNKAVSAPHPRPTNKGFDALIVVLPTTSDTSNVAVIICEDKATENSRRTIREDVWNEFSECESGARDGELISEITAILERHNPPNLDELIDQIHWQERRRYRVSITTSEDCQEAQARSRLFKGYDEVVPGDSPRRRAEAIQLDDLRQWMDEFCLRVVTVLNSMRQQTDV